MPSVVVLREFEDGVQDDTFSVDVFLPNGIVIPVNANIYMTFENLKDDVWCAACKYPLFKLLKKQEAYCFVNINQHGEKEEILDESQCLSDIRPNCTFISMTEMPGHKKLHQTLISLIGKEPKKVQSWQAAEMADFRSHMKVMCDRLVQDRNQKGWLEELAYRFPPRLRSSPDLPKKVKDNFPKGMLTVVQMDEEEGKKAYTMKIPLDGTPNVLIQDVLLKMSLSGHTVDHHTSYLLKAFAIEEYLYGDEHPLHQYKFVYQSLCSKSAPQFTLVTRDSILGDLHRPKVVHRRPSIDAGSDVRDGVDTGSVCVWDIHQKYHISVRGIRKIQIPDGTKVLLHMGLFHGTETLCPVQKSEECVVHGGECNMKTDVTFDIEARNIPHMARLSFTLFSKKASLSVAWVNVPVFDFRSLLTTGERDLPMWPHTSEGHTEEIFHPTGSVAPNPLTDTTTLTVRFPDFNQTKDILYPSFDKADPQILADAATRFAPKEASNARTNGDEERSTRRRFEAIVARNRCLSALYEWDKEILWNLRYECQRTYPYSLPKVLSSVKWNKHEDVAKMIALLQTWPKLEVDFALQLLDFNYPDKNVRKFAVSCLENKNLFSDDELSRYLLQLVQALKYETHLCNPLVQFLLTRALSNQHIGHQLFWLLKSEMYNPSVSIQNRLILEVFLSASEDLMMALHREQEALGKLSVINNLMKNERYTMADQKSQDQALKDMQLVLEQQTYLESLCNIYSPLSLLYKYDILDTESCRIMKSKKRPLWLVWKNSNGRKASLIYKNGDDLRQDMLTLQMLEIMDNIWQSEGLDLRMNVYRCMATGYEQGVIEAVGESETIAKIQTWFNKGAFDKKAVFEWLKLHNKTKADLDAAVEEFILSCAGYCVATYILGIGDRHNDNIMLKRSGQLFHIDFGHFLGNIKKKFFVKRDRVPFVLTNHFTHVIKAGTENERHPNYIRFQNYCERAYLILRRKAPLLFSLFLMMLSSGIPQLMCVKDVDYLRETLQPDLTEDEAREHFNKKFKLAEKNSWTATMNFCIHLLATGTSDGKN